MNIFAQSKLVIRMAKETAAIVGGVVIAVAICSLFSHFIDSDTAAITQQRELKYELDSRNQIAMKLISDYHSVEQSQTLVEQAFLPDDNVTSFISALDSIANKRSLPHDIHFDSPQPTDKTLGAGTTTLRQIPFGLSVQANIFVFNEFLKDLEHLPYFVTINSISIGSQSTKGWGDASNITIQGVLFTRGDE